MRSSTKLDGTDGTNNGVYCKWLAGVGWTLPDRMGSERIEGVVGRAGPDQTGPDWAGPDRTGSDRTRLARQACRARPGDKDGPWHKCSLWALFGLDIGFDFLMCCRCFGLGRC